RLRLRPTSPSVVRAGGRTELSRGRLSPDLRQPPFVICRFPRPLRPFALQEMVAMKSVSILLVETNPVLRKTMKVALDAEGYAVTEVHDATAALEAAKWQLPDVVLQNLALPDCEGFELANQLRALPGAAQLPIIAISNNADSWDKDWSSLFSD